MLCEHENISVVNIRAATYSHLYITVLGKYVCLKMVLFLKTVRETWCQIRCTLC